MKKLLLIITIYFLLITSAFSETLVIGHVTDSHIGAFSFQHFANVVNDLSYISDVIVVTGDCSADGQKKNLIKFLSVFEEIEIPYLIIPGNHDRISRREANWNEVIGPTESYIDIGESYRIIGINSERINWGFLDNALKTERTCIVVGHFPISINAKDEEALMSRFKYYRVPIYISGHKHSDYLEYDDGVYYLVGNIPPTFRLIILEDGKVKEIISGKMTIMKQKKGGE